MNYLSTEEIEFDENQIWLKIWLPKIVMQFNLEVNDENITFGFKFVYLILVSRNIMSKIFIKSFLNYILLAKSRISACWDN